MNVRRLVIAATAAALLTPSARGQEVFELDPAHCSIVFSVSHNNMSYTYGIFREAEGQVVIDRDDSSKCRFDLTIPVDSIDTNHPQRDQHLKSPDFLNAAQFPTITFESTACQVDNRQPEVTRFLVTGDLTIHGQTREVTLPVQMLGEGPGAGGSGFHAGFITQLEIKRSDFGMDNVLDIVGDAVGITVSFEAIRQDDTSASR